MDPQADTRPKTEAVRVRRATANDARAIAEIVVRGWQVAYHGILPNDFLAGLSVAAREVAWQARLDSPVAERGPGDAADGATASDADAAAAGAPTWVAEQAGRVLGFVASGPPRDEDVPPPAAEIYAIYVMPGEWRSGLGHALLTTAVDYWRERGTTTFVLWVIEANVHGRAFYEAMAWRPDRAYQAIDLGGFTTIEVRYRLRP